MENEAGASPFLLVCDHAGRRVPQALGSLGLKPAELERHIAWDIGAEDVAVRLAQLLGACLVRQTYSRLVVDCNRPPDHAQCIVEVSDETIVPANKGLSAAEVGRRVDEIHRPYQQAIAEVLDARAAQGRETILVSVHSFTPVMGGVARPWRYGVLHDNASPFSRAVLQRLSALGEAVGDNEPYSLEPAVDYTVPHHAGGRGLDYLELEIRQDTIASSETAHEVAATLAQVLTDALAMLEAE